MRVVARWLVAVCLLAVAVSLERAPVAGAAKWDPVDPKDLAETAPRVEKDADAEALLWEIRVEDRQVSAHDVQANFYHHVRLKVFTDRGREAYSRIDLTHGDTVHIKDVEARSIRRDGSFAELKKEEVFERTIARAGGIKVKATSFALPAVETGGIVEYRWTETHDDSSSNFLRLRFSRDVPVRLVRYQFVPLRIPDYMLQGRTFQTNETLKLTTEKGFSVVSMENVPARREEPYGPPSWDTEPWMLIYYVNVRPESADDYWLRFGKALGDEARETMSPTSDIRRATEALGLGGRSLDEKLASLLAFCRASVKRVDADTATDADRKGFVVNRSPTAALRAGRGTWYDTLGLFVAMAQAAGLDARLARLPSREDVTFDPALTHYQLLGYRVAAVRDGDRWRFVDPTNDHAPAGHLGWRHELVPALVGDKSARVWATTPAAPPDWSLYARTATFRLSEDGTLEGDVTVALDGHPAMRRREDEDHVAPAERETVVKEALVSRLPGAEPTGVAIENVLDPDKPYVTRYHVRIPGYAQRTGSRLFLQPAVFQKGTAPRFTATVRRSPVDIDYAWKEVDRVRIELPAGYRLESADAPAPVALPPAGGYAMKLTTTPDGGVVEMTREFFMGGGQRLLFPVDAYGPLKQFFDGVAKADAHTLTLKRATAAGGRP